MRAHFILLSVVGLCLSSCERHEWHTDADKGKDPKPDDTINLFLHEEHKEHKDHEGEGDKEKPKGDH